MFVRLSEFGRWGVVSDTVGQALPVGAFDDALNMRFTGAEMQKMLEPTLDILWDSATNGTPAWIQFWADGLSTYVALATATSLWFYADNGVDTGSWSVAGTGYSSDGQWQSFAWGDTCVFNNGIDTPQIFNPSTRLFEDLPGWGVISTADDILNNNEPSKTVQAAATIFIAVQDLSGRLWRD